MKKTILITLSAIFFAGCGDTEDLTNNINSGVNNQKYPSDKIIQVTDANMTTYDIVEGVYRAEERDGDKLNYLLIDDNGTLVPYTYDIQSECATIATENEANYIFKDKQLTLDANNSRYLLKIDNNTTFYWLYDDNKTLNSLAIKSNKLNLKFKSINNMGKLGDFDKNVNFSIYKAESKVYICKKI